MDAKQANGTTVLITGDTYPHRDALKALGGRWDGVVKGWWVPAERAEEARAIVPQRARRPGLRPNGPGGICTACGDDCGGTNWHCGYE